MITFKQYRNKPLIKNFFDLPEDLSKNEPSKIVENIEYDPHKDASLFDQKAYTKEQKTSLRNASSVPANAPAKGHESHKNMSTFENAVYLGGNERKTLHRHHTDHVHEAVDRFNSCFHEKSMNKEEFTSYAGVHPEKGKVLSKMGKGKKGILPSRLCSSTSEITAHGFAREHARRLHDEGKEVLGDDSVAHICMIHHSPKTSISVKNALPTSAKYLHEDEVVNRAGSEYEYHGHKDIKVDPTNPEHDRFHKLGIKTIRTHHITIHPKIHEPEHMYDDGSGIVYDPKTRKHLFKNAETIK